MLLLPINIPYLYKSLTKTYQYKTNPKKKIYNINIPYPTYCPKCNFKSFYQLKQHKQFLKDILGLITFHVFAIFIVLAIQDIFALLTILPTRDVFAILFIASGGDAARASFCPPKYLCPKCRTGYNIHLLIRRLQ